MLKAAAAESTRCQAATSITSQWCSARWRRERHGGSGVDAGAMCKVLSGLAFLNIAWAVHSLADRPRLHHAIYPLTDSLLSSPPRQAAPLSYAALSRLLRRDIDGAMSAIKRAWHCSHRQVSGVRKAAMQASARVPHLSSGPSLAKARSNI